LHITVEKPELFISKRGSLASSEIALVPPIITLRELDERAVLYKKSKEEKKALKKAKLNVDPNLAATNFISYANKNKIESLNMTINFVN